MSTPVQGAPSFHEQLERLLVEQLKTQPRNLQARLKLLELYYETQRIGPFMRNAQELAGQVIDKARSVEWQKCASMGRMLAPEAALLCLVDQPMVGAAQLQQLIERHRALPRHIIVSDHGETVGPPCLFPAEFYAELTQLSGALGARGVLQRHRERVETVDMPEAALDIDRPEDHVRALAEIGAAAVPRA